MKEGWHETTLGQISKVQSGAGFPKKYQGKSKGAFPFVKVGDMNLEKNQREIITANNWVTESVKNELKAKVYPTGSIIFPKIGAAIATNKKRIVKTPCCADNNVIGLIPNTRKILTEFLYYWMLQFDLSEFANKSNPPSMRKSTIEEFGLLIPSDINEQKRIVAILDGVFSGIDTAIANTEKNLANARELFESYLISAFNQHGKDWEEKRLGDLGKVQTGSTPKTSLKENFGNFIPFIKPGDFKKNGSLEYKNEGLSKKGLDGSRLVVADSVLMVCIGATIGKTGLCCKDITTNQQINSLTPSSTYSSKFIYYQMLAPWFQSNVLSNAGQATLSIINKSKWSNLKIWMPKSKETQSEIVSKLDSLYIEIENLEAIYNQKLTYLNELKQSLLHQAFTGQLTTPTKKPKTKAVA